MGWWGSGVLEFDMPMDMLDWAQDLVSTGELPSWRDLDESDRAQTASALAVYNGGLAKLARECHLVRSANLSVQVVGVLAMATTANLGFFALKVIEAAVNSCQCQLVVVSW